MFSLYATIPTLAFPKGLRTTSSSSGPNISKVGWSWSVTKLEKEKREKSEAQAQAEAEAEWRGRPPLAVATQALVIHGQLDRGGSRSRPPQPVDWPTGHLQNCNIIKSYLEPFSYICFCIYTSSPKTVSKNAVDKRRSIFKLTDCHGQMPESEHVSVSK